LRAPTGEPLTRIFYFYTDYYLGLACQYVLPSTVGHTGKRIKRTFKPCSIEHFKSIYRVQIFYSGARLFFLGNKLLWILGIGIWYIRKNFWVYKHVLRLTTSTNFGCWKGSRGGSRKQFFRSKQTELMNQRTLYILEIWKII
jgi:hypothetical protein